MEDSFPWKGLNPSPTAPVENPTSLNINSILNMKNLRKLIPAIAIAAAVSAVALSPVSLRAHCQVPCGIFSDDHRFAAMLEDQTTIAKANTELEKYVGELEGSVTALSLNQAARWIATKEDHCAHIQETIASYFMAQRIKPGDDQEAYVKTLTAAHAVMQAAMKAKQDPSAEVAETLKTKILDFYRAYTGKDYEAHSH